MKMTSFFLVVSRRREVPTLPFSREVELLDDLRRTLAIYRMVFGQSRQEDLITDLLSQISEGKRGAIATELQLDLNPSNSSQDKQNCGIVESDRALVHADAEG